MINFSRKLLIKYSRVLILRVHQPGANSILVLNRMAIRFMFRQP